MNFTPKTTGAPLFMHPDGSWSAGAAPTALSLSPHMGVEVSRAQE
jgi:hypothetical protein